jgi:hypothetical protein
MLAERVFRFRRTAGGRQCERAHEATSGSEPSKALVCGDQLSDRDEIVSTRLLRDVLRCDAGVFAAARRTKPVNGTAAEPIFVKTQKGAGVGELTALSATVAFATAVIGDR